MAAYDRYDERERERDRERPRRYVREERYEERDPRFDPQDNYLNVYPSPRDLVPRVREENDLAVEEIRREFPPPGARDVRRARSAEPIYEEYDVGYRRRYDTRYDPRYDSGRDRDRDRDRDREDYYLPPAKTSRKPAALGYRDEDIDPEASAKQHASSKQEKILAALAGAALVMGAKEVYDRHEAKQNDERDVQRNYLASAAIGAAGALAGYQGADFYSRQKAEKEKDKRKLVLQGREGPDDTRDGAERDKDKDDEAPGEKNFLEKLLAGGGIAAALAALTGKKIGGDGKPGDVKFEGLTKMQNAAKASVVAGATEAFHIAREPGGWKGEKARRILTAAAGAATIDAAQDGTKNSKLKLAESVIGGLVGNRVINGSKNNIEEDRATGRSRSRSRVASHKGGDSGGGGGGGGATGLAALASAGLAAFGGKKVMDHYRNESPDGKDRQSRRRRRDDSDDDDKPRRSRSRSVVDSARNRLAKLGIGSGADERDSHRRDQDDFGRSSSRPRQRHSDDWDDGRDRNRDKNRRRHRKDDDDDDDDDAYYDDGYHDRRRDRSRPRKTRSAASESDLGDSDDDARQAKKLKVYESVEKREARQKAVKEGRLSSEEAEKLKKKAIWQDTASVGIAALGIKSAARTLKEARERSHACREWKHEKELRHQRRLERQQQMRSQSHQGRASSLYRDDDLGDVGYDHGYASDWDGPSTRRGRTI